MARIGQAGPWRFAIPTGLRGLASGLADSGRDALGTIGFLLHKLKAKKGPVEKNSLWSGGSPVLYPPLCTARPTENRSEPPALCLPGTGGSSGNDLSANVPGRIPLALGTPVESPCGSRQYTLGNLGAVGRVRSPQGYGHLPPTAGNDADRSVEPQIINLKRFVKTEGGT